MNDSTTVLQLSSNICLLLLLASLFLSNIIKLKTYSQIIAVVTLAISSFSAYQSNQPNIFCLIILLSLGAFFIPKAPKASKAESNENNRNFESSFKYAAHGIALVSLEGRWLKVNHALCTLIGYNEEELLNKTFQDITYPDDLQSDLEFVQQMLRYERDTYQLEKRYIRKDGSLVWVLLSVSLVSDESNKPSYFVSQIQDITARKEANQKLEEAKLAAERATQEKSDFLSNMSHEIRTPLTSIIGFSEHLLNTELTQKDQKDIIATLVKNSKYLLEVVNDLLDFSKIEAGKLTLNIENCDLPGVIDFIDETFRYQALKKGIAWKVNITYPIPPVIKTDTLRLKQILLNLVSNAIKFTDTGEVQITISFNSKNKSVLFAVKDSGCGIDLSQSSQLFQGFYQTEKNTAKKYGGTGLGLAISKNLCVLLKGNLNVESQSGQGSTFTLEIPDNALSEMELIYDKPGKSLTTDSEKAYSYQGRVLVAEDNKDSQTLIKRLLEKSGLTVEVVSDGDQAISKATSEQFDLVLMDMQMPVLDGCAATSKLVSMGYEVPIVAFSANSSEETLRRIISAGYAGFLSKPFTSSELKCLLNKHIHKKSLKQPELLNQTEVSEIRQAYIATLPSQISELKKAISEANFNKATKLAHKISVAGMFGFKTIGDLARRLEESTKYSDEHESISLINQIETSSGLQNH